MALYLFLSLSLLHLLGLTSCYSLKKQAWARYSALETVLVDARKSNTVAKDLYFHVTIDFLTDAGGEEFHIDCPLWSCNSLESPCTPIERPERTQRSSDKMWWATFKDRMADFSHAHKLNVVFKASNLEGGPGTLSGCKVHTNKLSTAFPLIGSDSISDRLVLILNHAKQESPMPTLPFKNMSFVEAKQAIPSKNDPCYRELVSYTNCVKEKQDVRLCPNENRRLKDCRVRSTIKEESGYVRNTAKKKETKGYSFRSCGGAGGCPSAASAGAPPGELAGKMELPSPPVSSPGGEDVSDSSGVVVMSIVHTVMGSLVPQTVDHFAIKAQQEWPRVLTVSLIDGIPSNGNGNGAGSEGQPSNGDAPGEYKFREITPGPKSKPTIKMSTPRKMIEVETEARQSLAMADREVERAAENLKGLHISLAKLKGEVALSLKKSKEHSSKALAFESDEFRRGIEMKKANIQQQEAARKLELVASVADEIKKAAKHSNDAAELSAAAALKLRRIRREKKEEKERKARVQMENKKIAPELRSAKKDLELKHINPFLFIENHTTSKYCHAGNITIRLLGSYTELVRSFLADRQYEKVLEILTDAERAGTAAYLEMKKCHDLMLEYGLLTQQGTRPPVLMRFQSKSTAGHEMTRVLPVKEYLQGEDTVTGRSFPIHVLKQAQKLSKKQSEEVEALADARIAQNSVDSVVEACAMQRQEAQFAITNMDKSFSEVAKILVNFHIMFDNNGTEKRGKEMPPEVVQNVKRVRAYSEAILEEVNDVCKSLIGDTLNVAKLAWVKARLVQIEGTIDQAPYQLQMAEYMGTLYEKALKSAVKKEKPEPYTAPKEIKHPKIVKQKPIKPVVYAPAPKKPRLWKNTGALYDDTERPCTNPKKDGCTPTIKELKSALSFIEESGRPAPLGQRTGLGALPKMITNELNHALTSFFVKEVTAEFTYTMTPTISNSVIDSVKRESLDYLSTRISRALGDLLLRTVTFTVPITLNAMLPGQLLESLQLVLSRVLTRSITHAVTPSLIYSLGTPLKTLEAISTACDRDKKSSACQQLLQKVDSRTLYSDYYAAYFSDYYADYYTDKRKLENMDPSKYDGKDES